MNKKKHDSQMNLLPTTSAAVARVISNMFVLPSWSRASRAPGRGHPDLSKDSRAGGYWRETKVLMPYLSAAEQGATKGCTRKRCGSYQAEGKTTVNGLKAILKRQKQTGTDC